MRTYGFGWIAGSVILELTVNGWRTGRYQVVKTLSRMEDDIRREGICVNELECLLNTRERSLAVVDRQSGRRLRLAKAKYSHSIINVAVDFAPHFIAMSQRLAE